MTGRRGYAFWGAVLLAALLVACSPAPAAAPVSPAEVEVCEGNLPAGATDEAAIIALLNAEGAGVVQQDIAALMRLWLPEGRVVDAAHTPADLTDDQTWQNADAIRHRYLYRVFPGAPAQFQPPEREITIEGNAATITATTRIGAEISPGGDRWRVVKPDRCWLIQELVFNLEPF